MAQFVFMGMVKFSGARFFIEAETEEEAKRMAEYGECQEFNIATAEPTDLDIDPKTCEPNLND